MQTGPETKWSLDGSRSACFPAQSGMVDFINQSLFYARKTRNGIRAGRD